MENRKKILIIVGIILLVVVLGFGLFFGLRNQQTGSNNESSKDDGESVHYAEMAKTMHDYYTVYYKDMYIPKDKRENAIRVSLGQLERKGFAMDKFVNYKTGEACDTAMSYAIRTVEDNKYVIKVYFKCGNVSNYKLKRQSTTNIKTTKVSE